MKAVIVDAGYGRRLYPITKCISKGLVPVYDKPALLYQLAFLADMGVEEVAVVVSGTHYDTYKYFLDQIDTEGLKVSLYLQKTGAGIVAAYESCAEFTKENDILLMMGDCLYFVNDAKKLIRQAETCFRSDKVGIVIGKTKPGSHNEFMNQIQNFEALCENVDPEEVKKLSAIGMYFMPKTMSGSLNGFVQVELKDSDVDSVYAKLLQSGRILLPQYSLDDEWFDIGTPERLYVASAYVREKQNNTAKQ